MNVSRVLIAPLAIVSLAALAVSLPSSPRASESPSLRVGFAESDITPDVKARTVYIAGFGKNRKATGVHDPLKARATVLAHGKDKIAIVSVDVVGLFHASVERVRKSLPGFSYVLVSSTHNHEGPDTMGLWGPSAIASGVDPAYLKRLEEQIVAAVRQAEKSLMAVTARLGTARAPELLHDGRQPYIKHDEFVAIQFHDAKTKKCAGVIVQWNCHPETLDSRNTLISADYVWATVRHLEATQRAPAVYLTGTVGGLMTSLHVPIKDDAGNALKDGTFEKTERYGVLVGKLADRALAAATGVSLTPLRVRSRDVFLPLDNKLYVLAWKLGVLDRPAYLWMGDAARAKRAGTDVPPKTPLCVKTELAWLQLGDLSVAAIPGEIYPELVLGKVQDPADPGADFPDAPIEPAIYKQMPGPHRMIVGLANDELGYIIPKRQWDEKPPFCYGRKKSQYGEVNSLGPETASILCDVFRTLVKQP
ncbi:MAG: hypothetical protein FJ271_25890 [Planctomycetes bacterium]|nr:hypothetical protein [Planctomycetota bacterium]